MQVLGSHLLPASAAIVAPKPWHLKTLVILTHCWWGVSCMSLLQTVWTGPLSASPSLKSISMLSGEDKKKRVNMVKPQGSRRVEIRGPESYNTYLAMPSSVYGWQGSFLIPTQDLSLTKWSLRIIQNSFIEVRALMGLEGILFIKVNVFLPWLVWLTGLSAGLQTKGSLVESQSGHMPGLRARSPVQGTWEVTTYWCFSSSPSPSLPLSIKISR